MDSQLVRFLTLGYLRGWLDFENQTPLSELRQKHVLAFIEAEEILTALRVKAAHDSALSSGLLGAGAKLKSYDNNFIDRYIKLALPSYVKRDSIKDTKTLTKDDLLAWKKILQEMNKS